MEEEAKPPHLVGNLIMILKTMMIVFSHARFLCESVCLLIWHDCHFEFPLITPTRTYTLAVWEAVFIELCLPSPPSPIPSQCSSAPSEDDLTSALDACSLDCILFALVFKSDLKRDQSNDDTLKTEIE